MTEEDNKSYIAGREKIADVEMGLPEIMNVKISIGKLKSWDEKDSFVTYQKGKGLHIGEW